MSSEETSTPSLTPVQLRSQEQVDLKSDLGLGVSLAWVPALEPTAIREAWRACVPESLPSATQARCGGL